MYIVENKKSLTTALTLHYHKKPGTYLVCLTEICFYDRGVLPRAMAF